MAYAMAPLRTLEFDAERVPLRDKLYGGLHACDCCRHWAPFVQCSQVDCLACPECTAWRQRAYHRHLERLCAVYGRWCERTGLPQWSADELACHLLEQPDPNPAHVAWLRRFDAAWERHEARS